MKSKLTPEQSQRLIELGVDPSKASATRYIVSETEVYCGYTREIVVTDGYITDYVSQEPIFDLSDILSLLPKEIENEDGDPYGLQMDYDDKWEACYFNWVNFYTINKEGSMHSEFAPELIDALFELLVWTLKNHPDKIKRQ